MSVPKEVSKSIIFSLSIISILAVLILMINYQKTGNQFGRIHQILTFQLNISCIFHCSSFFFLYINKGDSIILCNLEGILNITFLLTTLLFTVSISFMSYSSFSQTENSFFKQNLKCINIVLSCLCWGLPILLTSICYICYAIKGDRAMRKYENETCWLNDKIKEFIYAYIVILVVTLTIGAYYTIRLMIGVFQTVKNSSERNNEITPCSFLPFFINILTFAPFVVNMVLIFFFQIEGNIYGFITDCLECLSGVTFGVVYEIRKFKCVCSSKEEEGRISEIDHHRLYDDSEVSLNDSTLIEMDKIDKKIMY